MKYEERKKIELATEFIKQGRYNEANGIMMELLANATEDAEFYKHIGMLYIAMGQYKLGAVYVRKSFDLEKSFETLRLLADVNFEAEKYDLSAVEYEELIKHEPEKILYEKCIKSYERLDFYEEAIRIAKMYNYATESVNSYSELIFMYITAGMEDMAIDTTEEMVKKFPNHIYTYNTLGFLHECIYNDYDKAKDYFKKASKLGFMDAYYNLGVCCKQSEDLENAEKYLKKLITVKADTQMDYNYTLGTIYLAERKLRMGYKYYQNRITAKIWKDRNKSNLWDGKSYPKDTLLVMTEQGLGDNIQFIRYLPMTLKHFKNVVFATRESLVSLFQRSFPKEKYPNLEIVSTDEMVKYSKFVLLMDLPYLLHQNYHNIPSAKSYLKANERDTDMMKTNYFNNDDLKIGLCWKSKGMGLRDAVYRTIDAPYYFKNLFDIPKTHYYSFQMGDIFGMLDKYPQITDLTHEFKDFSKTASALENLDILITVDTALAHLAGALGVKTYLLLCHAPDWRWFDNTEKTEWYPSVTIIKQQDRRSWEDVSVKLTEYINNEANKKQKGKL